MKNTVTLDLKLYHELHDFKKTIEVNKVILVKYVNGTYLESQYFSKDEFHKKIEIKDIEHSCEIRNLECEITKLQIKLKAVLSEKKLVKELNFIQKFFNY